VNRLRHSLVALVLGWLTACSTTAPVAPPPEASTPEETAATEAVEAARPIEPVRAGTRISIAAVGDMMIGTDYPENHLPDDDGVAFLAGVAPWLWPVDLAFGNLEGVLVDGGEPGKKCSNPKACYLFRSPSRYAFHYRAAGFDVLSLANNHARDFGEEGRTATMQALTDAGIYHSGREGDFASFEVKGLRVAVLAYAVTKNSNMLLDYLRAEQTVQEFAATHDIVIVSFHGGAEGRDVTRLPFADEEYYGEPRGDVVRFARMVVDAGADLVIGHGPHVVRAMERYKDRLIAYSLGNFATYYGISVAGIKGVAPILITTLDDEGRFVDGEIISTHQLRPAGPTLDREGRALKLIRGLSIEDFGNPGLTFHPDGRITPTDRPTVTRRTFPEDSP
jgi:poly-gamma-glutamate capsule biosynthesis protein CapA/YwtB (metallophosphatase superfamily)